MGPLRLTAIPRWTAFHLVPVLVTIVLLWLNIHGLYIGGELSGNTGQDEWKLFGLDLATLIFYLLVLASIWHMNSTMAQAWDDQHWRVLSGDTQVPDRSESLAPNSGLVRLTSGLLLLSCLSVMLLAPRAMIPELRNWEGGGTAFWLNSTRADLWPLRLDEMKDPPSCLASNNCLAPSIDGIGELLSYWPQTSSHLNVMPEQISLIGKGALRRMEVRFRGPFDYQPPLTSATIPSAQIADALAELAMYWSEANVNNCAAKKVNFCYYNDIEYSVETLQPVVFVRCNSNDPNDTLRFPRLDQGPTQFPLVDLDKRLLNTTLEDASSPISWIELPQESFGPSSIGAVVSLPSNESKIGQLLACAVDARWGNSLSKVAFSSGPMMVFGSPTNWFTSARFQTGHHAWTQMKINSQWAQNADLMPVENISVYTELSRQIAGGITTDTSYAANAVEAVIAMMLAESISRTMSTASIQGKLKVNNDWMGEMLPQRAYGNAGEAFNYSQGQDNANSRFEMRTTVNGYGYGLIGRRIPAVVALALYLFIVLFFLVTWLWQFLHSS